MTPEQRDQECDFCGSAFVICRYQCMDFPSESQEAGLLWGKNLETPPTNVVLESRSY